MWEERRHSLSVGYWLGLAFALAPDLIAKAKFSLLLVVHALECFCIAILFVAIISQHDK